MAAVILLLPLSIMLVVVGRAGLLYLATALLLNAWFVTAPIIAQRSNAMPRQLLLASIVYLPLLFACLIADQV